MSFIKSKSTLVRSECFLFFVKDVVCKNYTSFRVSFISDFTLFGSRDFFSAA